MCDVTAASLGLGPRARLGLGPPAVAGPWDVGPQSPARRSQPVLLPPWVSARVVGPHPCPWRQRAELTSVTIFNSGVCVTGDHTAASQAGHELGAFLKGALRESLSMREGLMKGGAESATESEIVSRKSLLGFQMASSWGPPCC